MIQINLLPVREILQRNKAKKQIYTVLGALCIVLLAIAALAFIQSNIISGKEKKLAQVKQNKQQYTKILNKIKQLEKETETLEKQIGVIGQLKASSSLTVHALDEVANLTPAKRMWLTSLSQSGNSLSLSGMALDNRTIAQFMDDLKSSPYINSVTLQSSALKGYAGKNLKAFSISCSLVAQVDKQEDQSSQPSQKKG